ncbi:latent-transforming growth factor beta-binding protein 4-like isoform X2 [Arapaima gigas]
MKTLTVTFCLLPDIAECLENPTVCGPNLDCTNTNGGYSCSCYLGYRAPPGVSHTNSSQPCQVFCRYR